MILNEIETRRKQEGSPMSDNIILLPWGAEIVILYNNITCHDYYTCPWPKIVNKMSSYLSWPLLMDYIWENDECT